jgi:hypothetical protein
MAFTKKTKTTIKKNCKCHSLPFCKRFKHFLYVGDVLRMSNPTHLEWSETKILCLRQCCKELGKLNFHDGRKELVGAKNSYRNAQMRRRRRKSLTGWGYPKYRQKKRALKIENVSNYPKYERVALRQIFATKKYERHCDYVNVCNRVRQKV